MRRALLTLRDHPVVHDAGIKVGTDQPKYSCLPDMPLQTAHEHVVIDPIKELLQIDIDHEPVSILHMLLCCEHRLTRAATGTKAMAMFTECGIDQRLQNL